jgi:hypothetical protein
MQQQRPQHRSLLQGTIMSLYCCCLYCCTNCCSSSHCCCCPALLFFLFSSTCSYGYDPLGLGKDKETVEKYRANELIHGRWAMLAAAGIIIPEGLQVRSGWTWGWMFILYIYRKIYSAYSGLYCC